jgi:hypothetical protein
VVSGHFLAGTDNTFDIGASGAMPRDLFLGRNAIVGGALTVSGAGVSSFVGNVGIGTPLPNSLLELSKSNADAATALRVTNSFSSTGSTDETADIDFYQGTGAAYFTSGRIRSFREGDYLTSNPQISGGLSFWTQTSDVEPATGFTEKMRITAAGNVSISVGALILTTSASPTGVGAGAVGQIAWDTAFLYVCTATNDWRRVALTDF